jgi:dephospho-CoA kinase
MLSTGKLSSNPPSWADLQIIGNELRGRFGPAVWAQRTLDKIRAAGATEAVVDGFRNPHEVAYFRSQSHFYLVAVNAPTEVRLRRLLERRRPGDPTTLDDFLRVDAKDQGVGEAEEGQQVGACLKLADFTISNDGTLEELRKQVGAVVDAIRNSQ